MTLPKIRLSLALASTIILQSCIFGPTRSDYLEASSSLASSASDLAVAIPATTRGFLSQERSRILTSYVNYLALQNAGIGSGSPWTTIKGEKLSKNRSIFLTEAKKFFCNNITEAQKASINAAFISEYSDHIAQLSGEPSGDGLTLLLQSILAKYENDQGKLPEIEKLTEEVEKKRGAALKRCEELLDAADYRLANRGGSEGDERSFAGALALGNVAYEGISTLLGAVNGVADILARAIDDKKRTDELVKYIEQHNDSNTKIIDELAVTAEAEKNRVIGSLAESYLLKFYSFADQYNKSRLGDKKTRLTITDSISLLEKEVIPPMKNVIVASEELSNMDEWGGAGDSQSSQLAKLEIALKSYKKASSDIAKINDEKSKISLKNVKTQLDRTRSLLNDISKEGKSAVEKFGEL